METVVKSRIELTDGEIQDVVRLKSTIWPPRPAKPENQRSGIKETGNETRGQIIRSNNMLLSDMESKESTVEQLVNAYKKSPPAFNRVILLYEKGTLIGHTEVFGRDIETEYGRVKNMALAGVCVLPEYRNEKLGSRLVRKAFSFIESHNFTCSIFQTAVPQFYEKLGCKIIQNGFINSEHEHNPQKSPWWDKYIMVYPLDTDLGDGVIDLRGNGY